MNFYLFIKKILLFAKKSHELNKINSQEGGI